MFWAFFRSIVDIHSCFTGVFARATRGLAFGDWGYATHSYDFFSFFVHFLFPHSISFFSEKLSLFLSFVSFSFLLDIAGHVEANVFRRSSDSSCRRTEGQCTISRNVANLAPMFSCFASFVDALCAIHNWWKFVDCFIFLTPRSVHMSTTYSFPAVPFIVQELKQQKREAEKLNVGSL